MISSVSEITSQVPVAGLVSSAIGLFLAGFGAYHLYAELRTTVTDEPSPATFSNEPKSLSTGRRAFAWVGSILMLLIGLGFVYMGSLDIYVCLFTDAASARC